MTHIDEVKEFLKTREDGTLVHRESMTLEFKESINFAGLADYYRDFAAFANNKGGYLVYGVKDRPRRELIGLTAKSKEQCDKLDPEGVAGHLLEDFSSHINWEFNTFELDGKNYAYFYVAEAKEKPVICKKDEGDNLKEGEIYFRYTGRTQRIRYTELEDIIKARLEEQNRQWMDMLTKFGKTGPANAAILDMDKRTLSTNEPQVLVVDEDLVERIKFIKEGEFVEKEGAPTLKLVGDVTPINKLEVVKHEKVNPLNEYPLSATELAKQVQEKSGMQQRNVWQIIKDKRLKENKDYAYYNFRYKKQADDYLRTGRVPQTVPSIYKLAAVDYIIKAANG
jgi:Predicted transcriptional regulator containing an HTH domain and an uncharacterized domain shared with the mammalian protein Schlafen